MNDIVRINQSDNVAVTLKDLKPEKELKWSEEYDDKREISVKDKIPSGHKIALTDMETGDKVVKYGNPIGRAKKRIRVGEWVHTHNLVTNLDKDSDRSYIYSPESSLKTAPPNQKAKTFDGYVRENGKVGIRNEIWLISGVGCINKLLENIEKKAEQKFSEILAGKNIDGIKTITHPYGCSQLGSDLVNTQKILAGLAKHPNAAGVLFCSLGCEENTVESFKKVMGNYNEKRIKFLSFQDVEDEIHQALTHIEDLLGYAARFQKEQCLLENLNLGLKCGGSDSFSGITANPLLGRVSDMLISSGGKAILSEIPEMFGAEHVLMNRAQNETLFENIVKVINDFKQYYRDHGQEIYENPSPGNLEGGITTLEEKSLGNIEKGGTGPIVGVKEYGETIDREKGVYILESPGNDLVSTTALAAAGAHIVLFTTGMGTPYGGPVPTVKISSNNELNDRKSSWIDFNAGSIIEGQNMADAKEELFEYILDLSSGEKRTLNEIHNMEEIAIFKNGVTL